VSLAGGADAAAASRARTLYVGVAVVTAVRILYLFVNGRALDPDEAQYWSWSRELELGYVTKPPLVAWAIRVSTVVLGNTEPAIRVLAPLAYAVASLAIYGAARRRETEHVATWAALTLLLAPGVTFSASIMSTDPLLLAFWSLALYAYVRAVSERSLRWWAAAGLATGAATLAKYTGAAFLASAALHLVASEEGRRSLRSPGPYAALALALVLMAPNLYWNARHGWVALAHVGAQSGLARGAGLHPFGLARFLGAQLAVFGPVAFPALAWTLLRARDRASRRVSGVWLAFAAPLLLGMSLQALVSRAYENWAAAAYPAGSVLVARALEGGRRRRWVAVGLAVNVGVALALYGSEWALSRTALPVPARWHPFWRTLGWREACRELAQLRDRHPATLFLAGNRKVLAEARYYARVPATDAFVWNPAHRPDRQFGAPARMEDAVGRDFLFVTARPETDSAIFARFRDVRYLGLLLRDTARVPLRLHAYLLGGFAGYARPQPPGPRAAPERGDAGSARRSRARRTGPGRTRGRAGGRRRRGDMPSPRRSGSRRRAARRCAPRARSPTTARRSDRRTPPVPRTRSQARARSSCARSSNLHLCFRDDREPDARPDGPADHPADRPGVRETDPQPVANAVLRAAVPARSVRNGHLQNPGEPVEPDQRGQEAVHAVEGEEALHARAPEHPQGAADVADPIPGRPVPDPVRDPRAETPEPGIAPFATPPVHEVRFGLLEDPEEPGDLRGVVLSVPVQRGEDRAPGVAETDGESGGLPVAAVEHDVAVARVALV
jgi:hypothetical protein